MFYPIAKTFIINTNFYYIVIDTDFQIATLLNSKHQLMFQNLFDTSTTDLLLFINLIIKPNKCLKCHSQSVINAISK